jgi:L-alanine-DL-glutamate epimerase-like enolase superfamily enzyme
VEQDAALVASAREVLGPERELMIDVQNRWQEVGRALATVRAIEPYRPFFIEAPFPPDNLEAYARLADAVDTRIAVGDWGCSTRFEFEELMVRGRVDVVQPSSVRSGGMSEILRIAEAAYRRGLLCIPHAWCHMVGVAAELHLAAVTPNMPYFEFPMAFPDSPVVSELLVPRLEIGADGTLEVPQRPGLGFRLNEDVLREYRVAPR